MENQASLHLQQSNTNKIQRQEQQNNKIKQKLSKQTKTTKKLGFPENPRKWKFSRKSSNKKTPGSFSPPSSRPFPGRAAGRVAGVGGNLLLPGRFSPGRVSRDGSPGIPLPGFRGERGARSSSQCLSWEFHSALCLLCYGILSVFIMLMEISLCLLFVICWLLFGISSSCIHSVFIVFHGFRVHGFFDCSCIWCFFCFGGCSSSWILSVFIIRMESALCSS